MPSKQSLPASKRPGRVASSLLSLAALLLNPMFFRCSLIATTVLVGLAAPIEQAQAVVPTSWTFNGTGIGTTSSTSTIATTTLPGGTVVTATIAGLNWYNSGPVVFSGAGLSSFPPSTPNQALGILVPGTCSITVPCGTITLTFSKPVGNPKFHISDLGGNISSGGLITGFRFAPISITSGETFSTIAQGSNTQLTNGNKTITLITQNNVTKPVNANSCGPVFGCGSYNIVGTSPYNSLSLQIDPLQKYGVSVPGDVALLTIDVTEYIQISGTVWDDANNSANNTFTNIFTAGESGTNGGGLYAILVNNATGLVLDSSPVNDGTTGTKGTYKFTQAPANSSNLSIRLSPTAGVVGLAAPAAAINSNWTNTSPLTTAAFSTVATNLVQDFGIEQLPDTTALSPASQTNPGGTVKVQVPTLAGTDPEDGALGSGKSFKIVTLPTNGTLYYNSLAATIGQVITIYDPTKLTLDPTATGADTVTFTYAAIDAAGKQDLTPATVSISFSAPPAPDLTITKNHTGNFTVGTPGTYALTVSNIDNAATTGTITVTDTLPTGLTIPNGSVSLTGTDAANWSCSAASNVITCTSTTAIAATTGTSTFNLTGIQVAATAIPSVTNSATVSGGGETNTANDTATDPTTVTVTVAAVSISGRVFEDMNYGGGEGRDFTTSGSNGRQNARVELYDATGAFKVFTTTDASGNYQFDSNNVTGGLTAGNYTVRVVNSSVTSSRPGYVNTLVSVQTFRTNGLTTNVGTADPNRVGGEAPQLADAGNGSTTLAALTTATTTAQSITSVAIGTAATTGINFGYNFDTIVNTNNTGQGSLRQFITNSNALTNTGLAQQGLTAGQETSIFMIPDGAAHPGLIAGLVNQVAGTGGNANAAVINLASNLSITDANTSLDATTQTINIGNSNSGTVGTGGIVGVDGLTLSTIPKPEVVLNFQAIPNNTNAILVSGANTVLKGFASYGYRSNNNLGTLLNAAIVIQSGVTNAGPATVTQLLGGTMADGSNPGVPTLTIGHTFQIAGAANISNNYLAYNADAISFENTNGTNVNFINNELAYNGPKDNNSSNVSGIYSDQMETVSGTKNITIRGNLVRNSSKPGFANAQGQGLQITYSTFITVENNTFSDNNVYGINAASSDTLIQKNIVTGTKNTGLGQGIGVAVYYGSGTGLRNRISQNSIYQNAKLGIDHLVSGTTPGVNPNDGTVNATLANNGMDYPIITSSTLSGGTLTVQGYVGNAAGGSAAFANVTLEFFLAADDGNNNGKVFISDPASVSLPHGEGKTYLGTLTTDGSGNFSGNLTVPAGVTLQVGDSLTATATDSVGNTSEFSANASVTVPVASNPELILVKRITAINTSPITTVIDPTTTPDPNDDAPNWPVAYLKGSVDTGIVRPGDELEYTIYFLSSGDTPITKVNICDLVPANSTFIPTTYNGLSPADGGLPGADSGIALTIGSSSFYLSNAKDTDRGEFFLADTTPSGTCSGANDNGAVVVDIVKGANTLPNATAPGTPTNSYGLIRFRALVK
jgi:trimeric autotransporter adhesin